MASSERKCWLVIEPHMDDAALSLGGHLLGRPADTDLVLVSVVATSNYAIGRSVEPGVAWNTTRVTERRREETRLVALALRATHQCIEWTDAPLRAAPDEEWSPSSAPRLMRRWEAWQTFGPDEAEIEALARHLELAIRNAEPDIVWLPMGVGEHLDHALTRAAGLRACAAITARDRAFDVRLYEDVPYRSRFPRHATQIARALDVHAAKPRRRSIGLGASHAAKLQLLRLYRSQFDVDAWSGWLTREEVYWEIGQVDAAARARPVELACDWAALEPRLARFLERREGLTLVVCFADGGRLGQATRALRSVFPAVTSLCLHDGRISVLRGRIARMRPTRVIVALPPWVYTRWEPSIHSLSLPAQVLVCRGLGTLTRAVERGARGVYSVSDVP